MNIIEAIKSGHRWLRMRLDGVIECADGSGDWEVEEQKVEITKSQLIEALDECILALHDAVREIDRLQKEIKELI